MSVTKNYRKMVEAADINGLTAYFTQTYVNKCYDLYCQQYEYGGFDYRKRNRLRALLWKSGTAWIRKNPIGDPVVCEYAAAQYNYDGLPETVTLINNRNAPTTEIPIGEQTVDKDGVIIWIRPCHKGFEEDAMYYIGKIAEAETCIAICLALQKMPWILTTDPMNAQKLKLLVKQIFSNDPVVYTDMAKEDIGMMELKSPYVIDKLTEYKKGVENDLKTLFGVDNQGGYLNREQQNLDTTNSNNDEINDMIGGQLSELEEGLKRANDTLGLHLTVKMTSKPVEQISRTPEGGDRDEIL